MKYKQGDILCWKVIERGPFAAFVISTGQRLIELVRRIPSAQNRYSHVAILEDDDNMIEATWPRVRRSQINWSDPRIEVRRVVGACEGSGAGAVSYARGCVGQWYDLGEFFFGMFRSAHRKICSRLVDEAWTSQSVELWPESDVVVTPDEIASSPVLVEVPRV